MPKKMMMFLGLGAFILGAILFLIYLFWRLFYRAKRGVTCAEPRPDALPGPKFNSVEEFDIKGKTSSSDSY
ncbi:unnamed protein product [Eruca vesicaria subsp. sativa]|uniref:ATP synthase F0 subunit 8 n=1 Tax=Eruca vesicaria subsp. sativa TaxID=29727 RepID=A0ABC8KFQ7_ERUVS|nr:unnamed protein product [Eruca vesicaria subsp. sativa]